MTKVYSVIHRALQEPDLSQRTAEELSSHEGNFFQYDNLDGPENYDCQTYYEIILQYNGYLKHLIAYKMNQDLLVLDSK